MVAHRSSEGPIAYSAGCRRSMAAIEEQLLLSAKYLASGNGSTSPYALAEAARICGSMTGLAISLVLIAQAHGQPSGPYEEMQRRYYRMAQSYSELRVPAQ